MRYDKRQNFQLQLLYALRPIYTWVRFRIRLAHFPKYKNNYILKNGLAYCKIARVNKPLTSMNVIAGIFVTLLNFFTLLNEKLSRGKLSQAKSPK